MADLVKTLRRGDMSTSINLDAADTIERLRARIAALEEALKSFAAEGMTFAAMWGDADRVATSIFDDDIHGALDKASFTVGDLRRAMRLLGVSSIYETMERAEGKV